MGETSPHIFVFIGKTGSGKSSFINNVCGKDVAPVSHGAIGSMTVKISKYEITMGGKPVVLIDTPGFDGYYPGEDAPSHNEILRDLDDFLSQNNMSGFHLAVVYNVEDEAPMATLDRGGWRILDGILTRAAKHIEIYTTHWDLVTHGEFLDVALVNEMKEGLDSKGTFTGDLLDGRSVVWAQSGKPVEGADGLYYTPRQHISRRVLGRMDPDHGADDDISSVCSDTGPEDCESKGDSDVDEDSPESAAEDMISDLREKLEAMTRERDALSERCKLLQTRNEELTAELESRSHTPSDDQAPDADDEPAPALFPADIPLPGDSDPTRREIPPVLEAFIHQVMDTASTFAQGLDNIVTANQRLREKRDEAAAAVEAAKSEYFELQEEVKDITEEYQRVLEEHKGHCGREKELELELSRLDTGKRTPRTSRRFGKGLPDSRKRLEASLKAAQAGKEETSASLAATKDAYNGGRRELASQALKVNTLIQRHGGLQRMVTISEEMTGSQQKYEKPFLHAKEHATKILLGTYEGIGSLRNLAQNFFQGGTDEPFRIDFEAHDGCDYSCLPRLSDSEDWRPHVDSLCNEYVFAIAMNLMMVEAVNAGASAFKGALAEFGEGWRQDIRYAFQDTEIDFMEHWIPILDDETFGSGTGMTPA